MYKKSNPILLFTVLGVSYGIQPLTTKDGFGLTFSGDKDPSISSVSIDGSSVSEPLPDKGGFRLKFLGEEPSVDLGDNVIQNGDLTSSNESWKGDGVFEKYSGRGGTGAICLTPGLHSYQVFKFNESNENAYGVRISGWSKATDADGKEDSDYSLYMDIRYKDGAPDWGIGVTVIIFIHSTLLCLTIPPFNSFFSSQLERMIIPTRKNTMILKSLSSPSSFT